MNICLVMAGDEEGGLEKHVVELAAGLAERGHHVSLIAHEKYRARLHPTIGFYAVNLAKSRRNLIVLFQLWYVLRQISPDVVHAHGNKAAAMVGPLLRWLNVGSVATLHSKKNKTKMFAPFDQVIAVSAIAAQTLQHPHIQVVLNGIASPIINACKKISPPMVLAVGRLVAVKGYDVLLHAWAKLAVPAQLWIAGEGQQHAKLSQLIQSLGLAQHVQLLGQRDDIAQLMRQATVHVISSHYEGGPYTLAEALLVDTPVVGTDVGMMADFVPAIYRCTFNDSDALAHVLMQALQHSDQLLQDFLPVFEQAKQRLTLSAMLDQVEQVYQDVITQGKKE